jgi:histidyl-tRNA synthetase
MENLSTLTGKYGDEGDKLIFKVLNSGDYLAKVPSAKLESHNSQLLTSEISEKALRYDLTVPFARYVVMHRNEISFPFKRYQIQPVWRADRPQKGRYREFYQCDADVVGSESLINEAEFVLIYHEALSKLGLKDFTVKINNRKILSGIAEIIGKPELIIDMTVAIDKLDKIGFEGVSKELIERGFTESDIEKLKPIINLSGSNDEKLNSLRSVLATSETGLKGISEIETIFSYLSRLSLPDSQYSILNLELDITLARGLNYYTGAIFEVKTNEVAMGSIGGGGRYDDLTGMFGLNDLTGVGISFGADRIYDVLEELNLFPETSSDNTRVLISNFDTSAENYALPLLQELRNSGISAEIYPSSAKLKKQMSYADDKNIPFVILIGSEEMETGLLSLKNMKSGEQQKLNAEQIITYLQ